ncbi:MAG: thiamine pyrophosphate-binding protein [Candidatus Woesearchaeota archaeon]
MKQTTKLQEPAATTKQEQAVQVVKQTFTGGEILLKTLQELAKKHPGIRRIAGHHGGAILPFYEYYTKSELYKGYIHAPNEQIAGFIAKGYANTNNEVGVSIATSGPGATNLLTPLYDCFMDSTPVVFITANVPTTVSGSMAFQEAPITHMASTVTKKTYYVTQVEYLQETLHEAFNIARKGRPGPVLIDIPKDVLLAETTHKQVSIQEKTISLPIDVSTIREVISKAKKPLIYAGGGIKMADASTLLREFANKYEIPVTTTLKAKGVYPETHPLALRMLGMHGTAYANYAVHEADLLLVLGARFDDRVTANPDEFAKQAYIIHIDIDPKGIGKNRQPHITLQANVKEALKELLKEDIQTQDYTQWHKRIQELKQTYPLDYDRDKTLKAQQAIDILWAITKGEHAIIADVGQHQMWAAQHYATAIPNGFDTSAGSGTMGCSLAQGIGTYYARREAGEQTPVTVICGDESFLMNPQTLKLYAQEQLDILVLIIDNKEEDGTPGGMVKQWYTDVHNNTQQPVKGKTDIVAISEGFGVPAVETNNAEELIRHIEEAVSVKGPRLINIRVNPNEKCLPILPPGKTINEMRTYQDISSGR